VVLHFAHVAFVHFWCIATLLAADHFDGVATWHFARFASAADFSKTDI